ncbi:hypothetical protein VCHA53O466_40481 [Vibrio chagasii]|nr:hypothetical protein VCHA53O466_40481 [Vibrio chagasii]
MHPSQVNIIADTIVENVHFDGVYPDPSFDPFVGTFETKSKKTQISITFDLINGCDTDETEMLISINHSNGGVEIEHPDCCNINTLVDLTKNLLH